MEMIHVIREIKVVEQLNVKRIFGTNVRQHGVVGECSTYAKLKATCFISLKISEIGILWISYIIK